MTGEGAMKEVIAFAIMTLLTISTGAIACAGAGSTDQQNDTVHQLG
jgi:hypothetical protein